LATSYNPPLSVTPSKFNIMQRTSKSKHKFKIY
jgi:hypothetical protein